MAETGLYRHVTAIKRQLKTEGYTRDELEHLTGRVLIAQLNRICARARSARERHGADMALTG